MIISPASEDKTLDLLALDEALDRLTSLDPRQGKIVELHFFGGFGFQEIGDVLKLSERTVKRDWRIARIWLHGELSKTIDP